MKAARGGDAEDGAGREANVEKLAATVAKPGVAKKAAGKAESRASQTPGQSGVQGGARGGFPLFGLAIGALAGLAAYAVTELWIDPAARPVGGQTFIVFIGAFAASMLLTASRERWLRGGVHALLIGALIAGPTAFMLSAHSDVKNLSTFPPLFWFMVGAPLSGLILVALARASLAPRGDRYTELFSSGVTLPMIVAGSAIFALLGVVLLYSWTALMRSMNVNAFHQIFQQPWFMLPFLGGVAGLSIGLIKSLEPALNALRFGTLLFARFAMPLTAVFTLAFLGVLAVKGPDALFGAAAAGPALLGLAIAGMLIFNGVYQNGQSGPPPAWLRLSTIAALLAFPVYAGLAAILFGARIGELGLTPTRLACLVIAGLTTLYSVVGLAGVLTEVRWNAPRWMPLVAPLNAGMAIVWALTLILMASPFINAWSLSARQQEKFVLSGRANVETFDYGYLRFALGAAGADALNRLAGTTAHPKADAIRAGAARALAAPTYSLYENPAPAPEPVRESAPEEPAPARSGVDALDFNPKDSSEAPRDD